MPDVIEFPQTETNTVKDDEIRAMFGWNMTDEEVDTKRNELADFCDVLVDLAKELICQRP